MIPGVLSVLEGMDSEEKEMGEMILFMVLVVIMTTVAGLRTASAETITLQQGADGYAGCTTETLWGADAAEMDEPGYLYLRGAHNRLLIGFEMPADLADRILARARLRLFLPEARNPNTFTEIFCHEVTTPGEQISVDEQTNYDNGRRLGAVDSVELFAPPGPGWKHFPYLPPGVPEGGTWREFNITQLVEKWTEVTMKITGEFRRKDGSSAIMEAGDAIDDIFFGAGSPDDGIVTLLIGEVIRLGRD